MYFILKDVFLETGTPVLARRSRAPAARTAGRMLYGGGNREEKSCARGRGFKSKNPRWKPAPEDFHVRIIAGQA